MTDMSDRISRIELALEQEVGQRIRADHDLGHRVRYLERNVLMPALGRRIAGPIPWLWRLLRLDWRPRSPDSER